jgi:hypothetical protein
VFRDHTYLRLERLAPDIDFDTLSWEEGGWEPQTGWHSLDKPQWSYPDSGNERLNALEPSILGRCGDREAAVKAIAQVQAEGLYRVFANNIENYLHSRFHMDMDEIARLLGPPTPETPGESAQSPASDNNVDGGETL